jgi:hypothetical protein
MGVRLTPLKVMGGLVRERRQTTRFSPGVGWPLVTGNPRQTKLYFESQQQNMNKQATVERSPKRPGAAASDAQPAGQRRAGTTE